MELTPLNTPNEYTVEEQNVLLNLAHHAIDHGLQYRQVLAVDPADFEPKLTEQRATFVTLNLNGALRGCIGTLEAHRPLVVDIAHNAFAAAFSDPRFEPVSESEFEALEIHISILNPSETMSFNSEEDLIRQIRPGIDGLILSEGTLRSTFLPAVWESLKEPEAFLQHLKLKAGLPANYWSESLNVRRYTTTSFP